MQGFQTPFRFFRSGDGRTYVWSLIDGTTAVISDQEGHVILPSVKGPLSSQPNEDMVKLLSQLVSKSTVCAPVKPEASTSITTIAVPTKNRTTSLRQSLESLFRHVSRFGRKPTVIVSDDSDDETARRQNERISNELSQSFGIETRLYDRDTRKQLADQLLSAGLPAPIIEFALFGRRGFPENYGANRNLITLLTRGHNVLHLDDDVLVGRAVRTGNDEVGFRGHGDVYATKSLRDRSEAESVCGEMTFDMLGYHEEYLGKSLAWAAGRSTLGLDGGCSCLHLDWARSVGRIAITTTGYCGDIAMRDPWILQRSVDEQTKSSLWQLAVREQDFCHAREVQRGTDKVSIGHVNPLFGLIYALDNALYVPPFIPFGRGEDMLMSHMLCTPGTGNYTAYLPIAVGHFPSFNECLKRQHRTQRNQVTHLAGLLINLFQVLTNVPMSSLPEYRSKIFASNLESAASLPDHEFDALLRNACMLQANSEMASIAVALRNSNLLPYQVYELKRQLDSYENAITSSEFVIPREALGNGLVQRRAEMRKQIGLYGGLIKHWEEFMFTATRFQGQLDKANS